MGGGPPRERTDTPGDDVRILREISAYALHQHAHLALPQLLLLGGALSRGLGICHGVVLAPAHARQSEPLSERPDEADH